MHVFTLQHMHLYYVHEEHTNLSFESEDLTNSVSLDSGSQTTFLWVNCHSTENAVNR